MVAYDVYSETNPAFCGYALVAFIAAYLSENGDGPELPLAYLALPLAMSGDLDSTFGGTNKNTGLPEWLERNPQIQIELAGRLNATMDMVREAVRFACFVGIVELNEHARLHLGPRKLKKSAQNALSMGSIQVIKHAERLGYWFAKAGSSRVIFDSMGLTV